VGVAQGFVQTRLAIPQFTLRGKSIREVFGALSVALKRGGDPILNKQMGASGDAC